MKILIIDDSTINNILLQDILQDQGFETASVLDGYKAFRKIEEFNPDIIILDLMMPDINGIDVLKQLKKRKYDIPVIIISAYRDKKYEKEVFSYGAFAYLNKPVEVNLLFDTIDTCIKKEH
jgi:DNA-binding response OmpR family regulator